MWRPSFAARFLDRLMGANNRAQTSRPDDDEGYRELSNRLLACLDDAGKNDDYNERNDDGDNGGAGSSNNNNNNNNTNNRTNGVARKVRKHPSVTRFVSQRELGLRRTSFSFGRNCLRSLILSNNRTYALSEAHEEFGLLNIEGCLLLAHKSRKIYNIDIMEPLCYLDMLNDSDKIVSTLWVELAVNLEEGPSNCSPYWLIILTESRLICFDPLRQKVEAEFILPSDCCKFNSLAPNELGRTFCLLGVAVPESGVYRSISAVCECVIGVFDIYPLKFKGLFRLPKKVFGQSSNFSVISDMVIAFMKSPCETILYELADFQNHTEHGLFPSEQWINGKAVLPKPSVIKSEPKRCGRRIWGNWTSLEYSGLPYHILGVPWSPTAQYMLVSAADMKPPASLPFSLKPQKNTSLHIEGASMLFHSDESGRILRLEGPAIVSYSMKRAPDGKISFKEAWRTNLWLDDSFFSEKLRCSVSIKSRFGRVIKPTSDFEHDYKMVIKGIDIDIDCQIIIVITECDLHSPVFDDPKRPFDLIARRNVYMDEVDMCTVIFLLDDATGAIIKVAMMREPHRENTVLHFDMCGSMICFNQRGHRKSFLEIQRLQEIGVVEWEQPSKPDQVKQPDTVLTPTVSNRRQTRRSTRHAAGAVRETNNVRPAGVLSAGDLRSVIGRDGGGGGGGRPSNSNTQSSRRRRRRLRILYFDDDDDSSDSDYRPDSDY